MILEARFAFWDWLETKMALLSKNENRLLKMSVILLTGESWTTHTAKVLCLAWSPDNVKIGKILTKFWDYSQMPKKLFYHIHAKPAFERILHNIYKQNFWRAHLANTHQYATRRTHQITITNAKLWFFVFPYQPLEALTPTSSSGI